MLRITPDQISLLLSYHERNIENLTRHAIAEIPYHNMNSDTLILNYSDYLAGCLYSDCHSRYSAVYGPDVFLKSLQVLERLGVQNELSFEDKHVLKLTFDLFQIECCMMAIWLNSLLVGENIDKIKIVPTVPLCLKSQIEGRTKQEYKRPTSLELMEMIGWLGMTYGSLILTDTQAIYKALAVQICDVDEYALFLYNLLQHLFALSETMGTLAFTYYDLEVSDGFGK